MVMDKLTIANEMKEFDLKNRNFYTDLTDEERKKFSNFLMIRWGSSVQGSRDLQEFYVISTNERLNKHFFTINRHPQLQWLCASSVSPGMGAHRHQWISPKKKDENAANAGTKKKQLMTIFPNMKGSDTEAMSKLVTQKEIDTYMRELGKDK
jgi:hypothetical protein